MMRIDSEVPFSRSLATWLELHHAHLSQFGTLKQVEQQYLAWETVRLQTNPYLLPGTGFEGYFVGHCATPEAALEAVLATGQGILDAIARFYRYDYGLQKRLMRTLLRENSDPETIHIWSAYLGAALGRLRCQVSSSKEADVFRMQTYRIVNALPPIAYHERPFCITQSYAIGMAEDGHSRKIVVTPQALNDNQKDAWMVARYIGEFGHPLVRKFLDAA